MVEIGLSLQTAAELLLSCVTENDTEVLLVLVKIKIGGYALIRTGDPIIMSDVL